MVAVGMAIKVEQQKQINYERLNIFDVNRGRRILSCCGGRCDVGGLVVKSHLIPWRMALIRGYF